MMGQPDDAMVYAAEAVKAWDTMRVCHDAYLFTLAMPEAPHASNTEHFYDCVKGQLLRAEVINAAHLRLIDAHKEMDAALLKLANELGILISSAK